MVFRYLQESGTALLAPIRAHGARRGAIPQSPPEMASRAPAPTLRLPLQGLRALCYHLAALPWAHAAISACTGGQEKAPLKALSPVVYQD